MEGQMYGNFLLTESLSSVIFYMVVLVGIGKRMPVFLSFPLEDQNSGSQFTKH